MAKKIYAISYYYHEIMLFNLMVLGRIPVVMIGFSRIAEMFSKKLNEPAGKFSDRIINKPNIGKISSQLIAVWNQNHPYDLIQSYSI
jgi:hypothetical protein